MQDLAANAHQHTFAYSNVNVYWNTLDSMDLKIFHFFPFDSIERGA